MVLRAVSEASQRTWRFLLAHRADGLNEGRNESWAHRGRWFQSSFLRPILGRNPGPCEEATRRGFVCALVRVPRETEPIGRMHIWKESYCKELVPVTSGSVGKLETQESQWGSSSSPISRFETRKEAMLQFDMTIGKSRCSSSKAGRQAGIPSCSGEGPTFQSIQAFK